MEIYQTSSSQVAVLQQRSAAAPGTQAAFARRLAAFIKQAGVREVRDG
jgi:predicted ATP-grasp superfamily ATP-dependent carboligase